MSVPAPPVVRGSRSGRHAPGLDQPRERRAGRRDPGEPRGVTVDLARDVADARSVSTCAADLRRRRPASPSRPCDQGRSTSRFLAVEPEREAELAFTAPYALIEGVYVVPEGGPVRSVDDVDRHGVRVGVKRGFGLRPLPDPSAGDAPRSCGETRASTASCSRALEVGAGIRQPVTAGQSPTPATGSWSRPSCRSGRQSPPGVTTTRRPRLPPRPRREAEGVRVRRRGVRPGRVASDVTVAPPGDWHPPRAQRVRARNSSSAGVAAVDQGGDVRLRPSQGVDRGDALERLATGQVEDHGVPRRGGDGVGVLLQAAAPEVGPGVLRRLVLGALDGGVGRGAGRSDRAGPGGGRAPCRGGRRCTGSRSAGAWRCPSRCRRGRGRS